MGDRCILGLDIGGTNFRIGAVRSQGELTSFHKFPINRVFHTRSPLNDLAAFLTEYQTSLAQEGMEPEAVAIGFPATLDRERRRVLQAPNIPFMENLPVVEELTRRLEIPVFIERDVVT